MNKLLLYYNIIFHLFSLIYSITFELKIVKQSKIFRNLDSTVFGSSHSLHYYYSNLYLGKRGIKQSYILDTGSSITTSPCELCKYCGKHKNNYYKISNENIIKCKSDKCKMVNNYCLNETCSFSISYTEGSSLKGIYINEIIRFGNNINDINYTYIPIGCTTQETHLFKTQLADGIMGLSNSKLNFINLLKENNLIKNNIFSLCFGQNGGYFTIDEIQNKYHLSKNINYFKIENIGYYYYEIKNIKILNNTIEVNSPGLIDSGTTYTYFPYEISKQIEDLIIKECNKKENNGKCGKYENTKNLGTCFSFKDKNDINYAINNIFPNITFEYNDNIKYIWSPHNYYYDVIKNNKICFGFTGSNEKFILGSTWMRGHDIIFNMDNNTIGFVEADCNKGINFIIDDPDEKNNDKLNSFWNAYLIYFYLGIFSILIFIFIMFLFGINKLRKGKNFLCFNVDENQLKVITNINIEMKKQENLYQQYNLFPELK